MGQYFEGEVKTEIQLLDDLLQRKLIYEDEIDRKNKTITIGDREISYKIDGNIDLDPNTVLEPDTGKEEFIAEIETTNIHLTEEGIPDKYFGKFLALAPINISDVFSNVTGTEEIENPDVNIEIDWGDGTIERINRDNYSEYSILGSGMLEHGY